MCVCLCLVVGVLSLSKTESGASHMTDDDCHLLGIIIHCSPSMVCYLTPVPTWESGFTKE